MKNWLLKYEIPHYTINDNQHYAIQKNGSHINVTDWSLSELLDWHKNNKE